MSPNTNISLLTTNLNYPLIIECCSHQPDTEKLESLSSQITDWNGLLTSAYGHGVYPLIAKSLKGITTVPEQVKTTLKLTNIDIARRNMIMTSELLRVVQLLEDHGINALAIKGPVLSFMIHGDITLRQFSDVDVLIDESNLYRSGVLLSENGFSMEHDIEFLKNKTLLKIFKDVVFSSERAHLELHWRLFEDKFIQYQLAEQFSYETNTYKINGKNVKTLQQESLLYYLCLHGSKHFWERIEWIVDIDRLIRNQGIYQWENMYKFATKMKSEIMFLLGLAIAQRLFSTPLPEFILLKIDEHKKLDKLIDLMYSDIVNNFILEEAHDLISWKYFYFSSLIHDNFFNAINTFRKNILQIKPTDVYTINIPHSLSFLYYFIRPFRFIYDYVNFHKNKKKNENTQ